MPLRLAVSRNSDVLLDAFDEGFESFKSTEMAPGERTPPTNEV